MLPVSDDFLRALFSTYERASTSMQIFPLSNLPEKLPDICYPVIDRTFGYIFLVNGNHRMVTKKLGLAHLEAEKKDVQNKNEAIHLFLQYGYYWTGALSECPRLVTKKEFRFDALDIELSLRYRLSRMNPYFPTE